MNNIIEINENVKIELIKTVDGIWNFVLIRPGQAKEVYSCCCYSYDNAVEYANMVVKHWIEEKLI